MTIEPKLPQKPSSCGATRINGQLQRAFAEEPMDEWGLQCFEAGRQQGVEQERAMWELARVGQEIEYHTVYIYRHADTGVTQVRAPDINDKELVIDMLEEGLRAMHEGTEVNQQ